MRGRAIVFALIILCMSLVALADDTVYSEGFLNYTVSNEEVTITSYFGTDKTVRVPAEIAGMPVSSIASGAFAGTKAVTIYLPDCVVNVADGAFDASQTVVYDADSAGAQSPETTEDSEAETTEVFETETQNAGDETTAEVTTEEATVEESETASSVSASDEESLEAAAETISDIVDVGYIETEENANGGETIEETENASDSETVTYGDKAVEVRADETKNLETSDSELTKADEYVAKNADNTAITASETATSDPDEINSDRSKPNLLVITVLILLVLLIVVVAFMLHRDSINKHDEKEEE